MDKRSSERGVVQVIFLILLVLGLGLGTYLIKNPTFWGSHASLTGTRIEFFGPNVSQDVAISSSVNLRLVYAPPQVAEKITRKVFLVSYNPNLSSGKTLFASYGWSDPQTYATTFLNELNSAARGASFQIVGQATSPTFPLKADGFRYDENSYLNCRNDHSKCHFPDTISYKQLFADFSLNDKINSGQVDEVWLVGPGYFGADEYAMKYTDSILSQNPKLNVGGCQKNPNAGGYYRPYDIPSLNHSTFVMELNPEVGVDNALHAFGHRVEGTMALVTGNCTNQPGDSWSSDESNGWNRFALIGPQHYTPAKYQYAHCGNVHFPPNGSFGLGGDGYDYGNQVSVRSDCDDYLNYPALSGNYQPLTCSAWGCNQGGYMKWWLNHLPTGAGLTAGVLNDWWFYIVDPDNSTLNKNSVVRPLKLVNGPYPDSYRLANSQAELEKAVPKPFSSGSIETVWSLSPGNGQKQVFASFRVNGSWTSPISATITLQAKVSGSSNSPVTLKYSLDAGWNLIGVPVKPTTGYANSQTLRAEDLISATGCSEIDQYINGGWNGHLRGLSPNNFDIEGGKAYLIKCNAQDNKRAFSIEGIPQNDLPTLNPGWNAVALPYSNNYSSVRDFINAFPGSANSDIKEVDRYVAGGWDGALKLFANFVVNNFTVSNQSGYMIKYTPSGSKVPPLPLPAVSASGAPSSSTGFTISQPALMNKPGVVAFYFNYSGNSSNYIVDVSTQPDMSFDVYSGFGQGSSSPITVTNPTWDKLSCDRILYWRVSSGDRGKHSDIQSARVVCASATSPLPLISSPFGNLSASLNSKTAQFSFVYVGIQSPNYHIDLSTTPDMSVNTYSDFGQGSASPVVVSDPSNRWGSYLCGKTLYWRASDIYRKQTSEIKTSTVVCP